jgi:sugar/nucleoside kinase (ribokinase family)
MDLFALGTPVMDVFAKVDDSELSRLGLHKGATNFRKASELAAIEKMLGRRIIYRYPGDNARNVCEGFSALSGFCGFAGAVGNDKSGAAFGSNLQECNISGFLQEKRGSTGKILALVTPDGQRTFCADLGVSTACAKLERAAVKNSRMLYLSTITLVGKTMVAALARRYLETFRKAGKRIAISIENPPQVAHHRAYMLTLVKRYADVLFMNEDEAAALLGSGFGGKLFLLKPKIPIYLKRGAKGSILFHGCRRQFIPAQIAHAIDTTGAGDAYCAGTLYGLSRGYTPLSSGKIGCYLATKVVGKMGAGIPLRHTRMRMKVKIRKNIAAR